MKFEIMLDMLFVLLTRRKVSASYFAKKHDVSVRSIHRYVNELCCAGVPIDIIRGCQGGLCLPDTYRLPDNFLTVNELQCAVDALTLYSKQFSDENVATALDKILLQSKDAKTKLGFSGNVIVDSGSWGDVFSFSNKLNVLQQATNESITLFIEYLDKSGDYSKRLIEPHVLVLKQNEWYVYAYCHTRNDFRLFKLGRIKTARLDSCFIKRDFDRTKIPLTLWQDASTFIDITFEFYAEGVTLAVEWLGADNVKQNADGKMTANVRLPNDSTLITKILSFGTNAKVLSPDSLKNEIKARAANILHAYD